MEGGKATGYAFLTNSFEIRRYEQKPLLSGRQIAGITVGCLAFCAAIAGALFVVVRRKRTSRSAQEVAPARAEWRDSVDSIAVEKERARVATMETNA